MTETAIEFANAASLLNHLESEDRIAIRAPIDVDKIARELGIDVVDDYSLPTETVGMICFNGDEPALVKINPNQNAYFARRRFTLAHEIGHFCLHRGKSRKGFSDSEQTMSRTQSYWTPVESEANTFAAQLLMPKSLIMKEGQHIVEEHTRIFEENTIPSSVFISEMADRFGVSNKAMEYRLRNLGIIK